MKIVPAAGSIRRRLFWIVGGVSLGCLLVVNLVWLPGTIREIREAQEDLRRFAVRSARDQIGQLLAGKVHALTSATLLFRGPYLDEDRDELRLLAQRFLQREPAFEEVGIVRPEGKEILRISRRLAVTGQDLRDRSDSAIFQEGRRRPYWGAVEITETSEPWVTVGVPFKRSETGPAGVVYGALNLKSLWQLTEEFKLGSEGRAYVVDGMGRLIASNDPSLVLKQMAFADRDIVKRLISQRAGSGTAFVHDVYVNELAVKVVATGVLLDELRWGVIVEQSQSLLYAPVRRKLLFSLGLSVIGLLTSFNLAHLLSRRLSGPITRLREGVTEFGKGHLDRRIAVETSDEIGELAQQFNQMATQLRDSHRDLERRVREATQDLERRRREAEGLAQVARSLTESLDVKAVGERIVASVLPLFSVQSSTLRLLEPDGSLRAIAFGGQTLPSASGGDILRPGAGITGRSAVEGRSVWSSDVLGESEVVLTDEMRDHLVRSGNRAMIAVPLRAHDKIIGSLGLSDRTGRLFTEAEVSLLQTFADQAALAMENARLFEEAEQRRREVEVLDEIAQTINSSLDLDTMLQRIVDGARELCRGDMAAIALKEGASQAAVFRCWAGASTPEYGTVHIEPGKGAGGLVLETGRSFRTDNWPEDSRFTKEYRAIIERDGIISVLIVPIRIEEQVAGLLYVQNRTVRPFTDQDETILSRLADHAAVSLKNAKLFDETTQRAREVTALYEVGTTLVSTLRLSEILEKIVGSAVTLIGAQRSAVFELDQRDQHLHMRASRGMRPDQPFMPLKLGQGAAGSAALQRRPVFSPDVYTQPLPMYGDVYKGTGMTFWEVIQRRGYRSILAVPLLSKETVCGAICIYWDEVHAYDEREVHLLTALAQQAAVSIENARLYEETERRRREAEELAQVARTLTESLDVRAVSERCAEGVRKLLRVGSSSVFRLEPDGSLVALAVSGLIEKVHQAGFVMPAGAGVMGRAASTGEPVFVADLLSDPDLPPYSIQHDVARVAGRATLAVPLRSEGKTVGVLSVVDQAGRVFDEREVSLLKTFADQAALALENARLYEETERRRREAEELARVTRTLTERLDVQTVAERIVESVRRLLNVVEGTLFRLQADGSLAAIALSGLGGDPREVGYVLSPGAGVAGRAVARGEPVWCADILHDSDVIQTEIHHALVTSGVHALLAIPLRSKGEIIGALAVGDQVGRSYTDTDIALLQRFGDQAAIALENAQLYEETERRRNEAEELARIVGMLTESLDVSVVGQRIVESVLRLLAVDAAALWLLQPDGSMVGAASAGSARDRYPPGRVVMPRGTGMPGRAVSEGGPVWSGDVLSDNIPYSEELRNLFFAWGSVAALAVPFRMQGKIIGALVASDRIGRKFSDGEVVLLQTFASQAGIALEQARLHEETERRRREAEELARVARSLTESLDLAAVGERIVTSVRELFGVTASTLKLLEPDRSLRTLATAGEGFSVSSGRDILPAGAGLAGRAVTEGRPVWCADVLNEPEIRLTAEMRDYQLQSGNRAMIAVPLRAHEKIIGSLSLSDRTGRVYSDSEMTLLQTFADQAALALENARLYEETERRRREAEELAEVARTLTESLDLKAVAERIVEGVRKLLDVRDATVYQLQAERSLLALAVGGGSRLRKAGFTLPVGTGAAGQAVASGEPVFSAGILHDPKIVLAEIHQALEPLGDRSVLAVPLRSKGQIIGALSVSDQVGRLFTEAQTSLLQTFGDQAALAMENARLYEETKRGRREAEELAQVARTLTESLELQAVAKRIAEGVRELLNVAEATVFQLQPDRSLLALAVGGHPGDFSEAGFVIPPGAGVSGRAVATGESVFSADLLRDPVIVLADIHQRLVPAPGRAVLATPLRSKGKIIGVLTVSDEVGRVFTDAEVALVRAFADQAALALENAQLYADATRRQREAESLAEVGRLISKSLDPREVQQQIVDSVRALFRFRNAVLFRLEPETEDLVAVALSGEFDRFLPELRSQVGLSNPLEAGSARRAGFYTLPKGIGIGGLAVRERSVVTTENVLADPRIKLTPQMQRAFEQQSVRSGLSAPLIVKDRIIGAISFGDVEVRTFTAEEIQLAQAFADQAALAMENARLFEETRERSKELAISYAAASTFNRPVDLKTRLDEVLDNVADYFNAQAASLRLFDEEGKRLEYVATRGWPEELGNRLIGGRGFGAVAEHVVATGEPLISNDLTQDPLFREGRLPQFGFRSAIYVPIRVKEKIVGILDLLSPTPGRFDDEDKAILASLCNQIGMALESARLQEETRRRAEEQAALNAIATAVAQSRDVKELLEIALDKVLEVTERERVSIRLKDPATGEIALAAHRGFLQEEIEILTSRMQHEMVDRIFSTGQPVIINDATDDPSQIRLRQSSSVAWVPLKAGGRVVGVLGISASRPKPFSSREVDLLQAIGNVIGVGLENVRLFQETERRAEEQAVVSAIATAMNQSLHLNELLQIALDKVLEVTGREAGHIRYQSRSGGELDLFAARGISETLQHALIHARRPGGRSARVMATGEPLVLNDTAEGDLRDDVKREDIRAQVWVPLMGKGGAVGVLCVCARGPLPFTAPEVDLLKTLGSVIGVSLDNARLFEETERGARELSTLYAVTTSANQTLELGTVCEEVFQKVKEMFRFDEGRIYLFTAERDELRLQASFDSGKSAWRPPEVFLPGQGNVGKVATTEQPIIYENTQDDPHYRETTHSGEMEKSGLSFFAAFPIKAKLKTVGVMVCAGRSPRRLTPDEVRLLTAIGNQIGVAVENARLFEETERRRQEAEELARVVRMLTESLDMRTVGERIVDSVLRLFDPQNAVLRLLQPDGSLVALAFAGSASAHIPVGHVLSSGAATAGKAVIERRPVTTKDLWNDPNVTVNEDIHDRLVGAGTFSAVSVPLSAKGEVIGSLSLGDKPGRVFSQHEVALLQLFGDQAALALENARLYEDSRGLVQDLKAMTQELGVKNKELDTFVYTVSHDLKAPLVTLQGMAELLLEGHGSAIDEKGQHYLRRLKANAQQMERLIIDLLALSRIGREGRSAVAVPLGEVVEDLLLEWGETIKTRGINVACHDLPTLWGVRTRIEQVMSNLVGNAIKYLGEPSEPLIEIGAKDDGGPMVECYVRDNGIGIDPAYHEKVFEIFQRLKETEAEGTGVGLAIVKKIVDGAGGRIWVESAKGQGSTFRFTWPKARGREAE